MTVTDAAIQECLLRLVGDRGPTKTICPSEVARSLDAEQWRELMPQVRAIGSQLAKSGAIAVMQKGQVVNPDQVKGPIRYRLQTDGTTDQ